MAQHAAQLLFIFLAASWVSLSPAVNLQKLQQALLEESSSSSGDFNGSFTCTFDMFEAMGVCNTEDYKSCCTSVKTALYSGCLCSRVFQDYIRYCIEVTRELSEYLDDNCIAEQAKIDQVVCYQNLTYHEPHDPEAYSICPLVSATPSSMPDPDDRVSPWQWFWNTSGTLPPSSPPGPGPESVSPPADPPPQAESSPASTLTPPASKAPSSTSSETITPLGFESLILALLFTL